MQPNPNENQGRITAWLHRSPEVCLVLFAIFASFSTYFCMYAFRKPFSAASYDGLLFLDSQIELKTAFITSQLIGYILSKFIGIKVCSEITRNRRTMMLLSMILVAQLSLLAFGWLPEQWKFLAIFCNGLPLGMIWGLVVWYLEGRRASEFLLAGLSCSFIVASGIVKDIGKYVMTNWSVSEYWMPSVVGWMFLVPFFIAIWLLNQIPEPTSRDIEARTKRVTMDASHRWAFLKEFSVGLTMLFIAYFFLTAFRDYRDNFGIEIFKELGYDGKPGIFTRTELPVGFGVVAVLAALSLAKSNRWGLVAVFSVMLSGCAMMGIGTLLFDAEIISGLTWMILIGLGAYLAYVPFGSVLFDRLIASTHVVATAVFVIYVADALGYLGVITIMITKDLLHEKMSRLEFLHHFTYFLSVLGCVLVVLSCIYFQHQVKIARANHENPPQT